MVADGLADDGIENDGQQAAGEAVVIQVNALHRGSGVEHHGGVEEPRHDAEGPAEIARDRGQSGSEQEGELHGALVDIEVHKNAADDHAHGHIQHIAPHGEGLKLFYKFFHGKIL